MKIRNFTFSGCKDSHKNFWAPPIETARDRNRRSLARGINPASSIFRALTWKSWSQNTYQCRFVQLYNSCSGSTSHRGYDPFQQSYAAGDWTLQNARPAPYCLYSQAAGQSYFPPKGNCFGYVANEWMTFQIHFKFGLRVGDEFLNSYVNMWIAREDQRSELVFNWGPYNLSGGSRMADQKFRKIWFLPYHTGKRLLPGSSYRVCLVRRTGHLPKKDSGSRPQPGEIRFPLKISPPVCRSVQCRRANNAGLDCSPVVFLKKIRRIEKDAN